MSTKAERRAKKQEARWARQLRKLGQRYCDRHRIPQRPAAPLFPWFGEFRAEELYELAKRINAD